MPNATDGFMRRGNNSKPQAIAVDRRAAAAISCLLAAIAGCATLPLAGAKKTDSATIEKADERQQETLGAVEEFLARTKEYSSKPPAAQEEPTPTAAMPVKQFLDTQALGKAEPIKEQDAPAAAGERPRDEVVVNTQVTIAPASPSRPPLAIPALQEVSVHAPALAGDQRALEGVKASAANTPLDARSNEEALWDRLLKELSHQVELKKDVDAEWRLRLAQIAADRPADARQLSASLPAEAGGVLTAYMDATAAIRDVARNPAMNADEALDRVSKLEAKLSEQCDPAVSSIALCRKVLTFGAYEAMTKDDFVAGRSTQTIVYCEVDHLRPEQTADGQFQTRLSTRLEVLTSEGKSVWHREEPEITDTCRQQRRDFFIAQRITLPPTLAAGDYVLKVSVEDKISNRTGESTYPFTIVAPLSVAKGG